MSGGNRRGRRPEVRPARERPRARKGRPSPASGGRRPVPAPRAKNNRRLASKDASRVRAPRAPRVPFRERLVSLRERARATWRRARRPLWIAARALLVVLVAGGAVAVGRLVEKHVRTSPAFATKSIAVEGHDRLGRETILGAAGLAVGQNVFELAPEDAEARLVAHPWIADADVRRRLPDTFEIVLREHRPVAVLALARGTGEGDTLYLVGEEGTVFKRVTTDDPLDLPVVTGVDRARFASDLSWRTSLLVEVVALLHDYRGAGLWRREPIAEVHVEADDGFTLYVGDDATQVRLGRGPFRTKLRRLRRVLDRLDQRETRPAYVYLDNVRRPDRVTVRLR